MALTISEKKEGSDMANIVTVDRKLWLTADRDKLVEDGDPAAAFLWASEGDEVPSDEADRLGFQASSQSSQDDGRPAKSASKGEWVDYAVAQGADREAAEDATKDDLVNADDYTTFTADGE